MRAITTPATTVSRIWAWLANADIHPASHAEKLLSAVGALLGILAILFISGWALGLEGASLIVASMGATAVLLFAVPHGALSRPWPVLGGHMVSAAVGVTCTRLVHDPLAAAALAVGISVGAMYYLRCIHPPGGATALSAVLGGAPVHALGYGFLLTPVLLNIVILLGIAVAFNRPFAWRRYPSPAIVKPDPLKGEKYLIAHSDLVYALSELDSFIDVSEEDLLRIYDLAVGHARTPSDPRPGTAHTPVPAH